jgi:ribosomal-protein-alanine N-acetyltransferase
MSAALQIELATGADARDIAHLSRTAIEHDLPWRWTPARVGKALAHRSTNVAVVRQAGALAAFGIMKYGDHTAHLLLLAVHETQRRRGLGSALLGWLEQVGLAAGIACFRLEARDDNAAALAFYRCHGYAIKGRVLGMYAGMDDAVCLEKRLPPAAPA